MILKLILLLIGGSLLLLAVRRLSEYKLKERYTLIFLFIGTPFLVLALWPAALGWVAEQLHIDYRMLALLGVVAFFLLMILELLTIVSVQDRKIAVLAQMVGILMKNHEQGNAKLKPVESAQDAEVLRPQLSHVVKSGEARIGGAAARPAERSVPVTHG